MQEHLLFVAGGDAGVMLQMRTLTVGGYYDLLAARYRYMKTMRGDK